MFKLSGSHHVLCMHLWSICSCPYVDQYLLGHFVLSVMNIPISCAGLKNVVFRDALTAVTMSNVFWDITLCFLVGTDVSENMSPLNLHSSQPLHEAFFTVRQTAYARCEHREDGGDMFSETSVLSRSTRCNIPKEIRHVSVLSLLSSQLN
jgi:hypothetical protein